MQKKILTLMLLLPLLRADAADAVGDIVAGKKAWDARRCLDCHGQDGEGGYGPDLAGRVYTYEHMKYQVRKPVGMMPDFTESQISDKDLANVRAYLMSLPVVPKLAEWRVPVRANVPRGQFLIIAYACAQCHDSELRNPREALGGVASDVSYKYFSEFAYTHTEVYSTGRMGSFSKVAVPESILEEIYHFATEDLGLIPTVASAIGPPEADGPNTTYKVYVKNRGIVGKGLTAEDVTITVALKAGNKLISAVGEGYQEVQNQPGRKGEFAVWKLAKLGPTESKIYKVTLAGKTGTSPEVFAKDSEVRWEKPLMRAGVTNPETLDIDPLLGPGRVAHVNMFLNRPISADNDWPGGAEPPGLCSAVAKVRGMVGCK